MASFQAPPTYADVVLVNENDPKAKPKFNPIWLKWFLDLAAFITASGGGSGGSVVHNSTTGKQGGGGTEFYHLIGTDYSKVTGNAFPSMTITGGRLQQKRGNDVVSANNLTVGTDGNYFRITGATQLNLLDSGSWQGGSIVTLLFVSTPTVKHNQAASGAFKPFWLNGSVDFATTAKSTLTLRYDDTDTTWYEIGRSKS